MGFAAQTAARTETPSFQHGERDRNPVLYSSTFNSTSFKIREGKPQKETQNLQKR